MNLKVISHNSENTHRPATNYAARRLTPQDSPSSRAMRRSFNEHSVADRFSKQVSL